MLLMTRSLGAVCMLLQVGVGLALFSFVDAVFNWKESSAICLGSGAHTSRK